MYYLQNNVMLKTYSISYAALVLISLYNYPAISILSHLYCCNVQKLKINLSIYLFDDGDERTPHDRISLSMLSDQWSGKLKIGPGNLKKDSHWNFRYGESIDQLINLVWPYGIMDFSGEVNMDCYGPT